MNTVVHCSVVTDLYVLHMIAIRCILNCICGRLVGNVRENKTHRNSNENARRKKIHHKLQNLA